MSKMAEKLDLSVLEGFEGAIAPFPVNIETVDVVVFGESSPFHSYINEVVEHLSSVAYGARYNLMPTEEELKNYLFTIVADRVNRTGGQHKLVVIRNPRQVINVPAFLNIMIRHIGLVDISEQGVTLKPVLNWDLTKRHAHTTDENGNLKEPEFTLLTEEQMLRVSQRIGHLARHGVVFAEGLPREIDGDFEVMTMEMIGDELRSGDARAHYSKAVIAGFLGLQGYKRAVGESHFRVKYGDIKTFQTLVYTLMTR